MKRSSVWAAIACLVVLPFIPAHGKDIAEKDDMDLFQGGWLLMSAHRDGKAMPKEEVQTVRLTIQGDEFVLEKAGTVVSRGTFSLNASKRPKEIDETLAIGPNKGKVFLAIYEIDAEQHRICFGALGKERPRDFCSLAGSGNLLQVWKRERK